MKPKNGFPDLARGGFAGYISAVCCAVAFLMAELIAHPFAEFAICDDWSYIRTAQLLAQTGHLVYNGWATAMLGWQLYFAAALIKVFGFSFSTTRFSMLIVGTLTTFLLQRVFVRSGLNQRNASIGTLALVLSPLYMELSATFMTDIGGLFAIVICMYGCLRAVQASSENSAAWVVFAALTNGVFGTSRQIAWLGVLVIVPCTLFLLRKQRRVLVIGGLAMLLGWAMVLGGIHWFGQQPYSLPESAAVKIHGLRTIAYMARQLGRMALDIPLLLLALFVAFLPELRRNGWKFLAIIALCAAGYTVVAVHLVRVHSPGDVLQPLLGDWVGAHAHFEGNGLNGAEPVVLNGVVRTLLTIASGLGLFCVMAFLRRLPRLIRLAEQRTSTPAGASWWQITVLFGPFFAAYWVLMIPRSAANLMDRYLLALLVVVALFLIRLYQDFVRPALPTATVAVAAVFALYSIGSIHDMFAFYRARGEAIQEVEAAGVPDTAIDAGWEEDGWIELQHSAYINDERLVNPPHAYIAGLSGPHMSCTPKSDINTANPHFQPQVGLAFQPDACHGPAPFAPVAYRRWLGPTGHLYIVKYGPRP